ncbi:LOW QUALITY PROTEIN: NTPase KAP family P-loop domain-containing protein 1-like [Xenentodon cancila]
MLLPSVASQPVHCCGGSEHPGLPGAQMMLDEFRNEGNNGMGVLGSLLNASLRVPAVGLLKCALPFAENLIFSLGRVIRKEMDDDVFAYALSKTLTNVSSPATVGLYSSCQDRLKRILKQMEEYMDREASRIEKNIKERPRSAKPSFKGFLTLIWRLLFYRPVWRKENQHKGGIRFIYVDFSAWHFAGSDLLWAGIAIRLFQAIQRDFGKLTLALYRVVQHKEDEEAKEKIQTVTDGENYWKSKKMCCLLWLFILPIAVALTISVFLLIYGLPKAKDETDEVSGENNGQIGVLGGLLIPSLGVPAATLLIYAFLIGKNLIFSQDRKITRGMDNERISSQLGFMNDVRKELWFLSRFIQFMEVFERRRIRVVLKISHLDRCTPKKIVAVLDAINILLSDEDSPFISILAVKPDVLLEKVNFADGCSKEDRAYALLNQIVTLAFTVPPLGRNLKSNLFYSLISKQKSERSSHDPHSVKVEQSEDQPLIDINKAALDVKEEEVEDWVGQILTCSEKKLNKYMLDDTISMRRVINSIRVTVIIMKALGQDLPHPETVAAFVVLANQWPCRFSWIIQCAEDDKQTKQRAENDGTATAEGPKTLLKLFNESRGELYSMSSQITDLLEQDGDPELFEELLKEFIFTINSLETFQKAMVNLDQSIKNQLAHIRATSRLKDSGGMGELAPLPTTTIIKMSTADLCEEMKRRKFDMKYIDKVIDNKINGAALVVGDAEDLKDLLDMTFSEWATFRLHFLSLPSHLREHEHPGLPGAQMMLDEFRNEGNAGMGVLGSLLNASLRVPAVGLLKCALPFAENLIFSLGRVIRKEMDGEKISGRLGFMNDVGEKYGFISLHPVYGGV